MEGMNFFQRFSPLHILWLLWLIYMLEKLLPFQAWKPRGCMKYRKDRFVPTKEYEAWLKNKCKDTALPAPYKKQQKWYNKGAGIVCVCWLLTAVVIDILYIHHILNNQMLLLASCLFYIGDLVCILFWCPFRAVIMKNRCCTQCRIYNWDTLMLVLPIAFVSGFYSYSLLFLALVNVGIWELTALLHPERYYPATNASLTCANCEGEPGCANER